MNSCETVRAAAVSRMASRSWVTPPWMRSQARLRPFARPGAGLPPGLSLGQDSGDASPRSAGRQGCSRDKDDTKHMTIDRTDRFIARLERLGGMLPDSRPDKRAFAALRRIPA